MKISQYLTHEHLELLLSNLELDSRIFMKTKTFVENELLYFDFESSFDDLFEQIDDTEIHIKKL